MIKNNYFNSNFYYLGRVCKSNHYFLETDKSLRQTVNHTCVECQKVTSKRYRESNKNICNERSARWRRRITQKVGAIKCVEKKCNDCGKLKSTSEFYPAKYSAEGLLGHCKICDAKRQDVYRAKRRKPRILKDPELIKENKRIIKRRYKKSTKGKLAAAKTHHRRKALLKKTYTENYTPTDLLLRFAEFENKCAYCDGSEKISIDHFIPISKFGADCLDNIVPACLKCNASKNNKAPEVWFKVQSFFSQTKWQNITAKVKIYSPN